MSLIMVLCITDNGQKTVFVKAKVYKSGKMEASIKDTGEMIEQMDMVD